MIKLLNYCDAEKGKITKKIFWCVKKYEYLGCTFYCVKARRNLTYSKYLWKNVPKLLKYVYIEPVSGCCLLHSFSTEVLSEKKFKKEVRRRLTKQSRYDGRGSLKSLIQDRREEYK
ncbi:MAG: hypothetical protein MJ176_03020 [Treponema sp.]|nr:hypothetical protein [Treponema sp.]